jgi:hypothetical protein
MNKAKQRKLKAEAERGAAAPAVKPGWGIEMLVIVFVVGFVLGVIAGANLVRDRSDPVIVPAPTAQQPPAADAHGRAPGDEHYGHDHP